MTRALLLLPLLTACDTDGIDSAAPPALADLSGTLLDYYEGDAPVEGAWVVVDDGEAVISTRTGADGSFSLPGLPAEAPVTLTFLAEDREAMTFLGFVVGDHEMPIALHGCSLRDLAAYERPTLEVEGTLSGAPQGSYVLLYGEDDYHDYVSGAGDAPVPFGFTAHLSEGAERFRFSAFAIDAGYATLGVAYEEVDATGGDVTGLDLTLTPAEALSPLTIAFDAPTLDGVLLAEIPEENCIYAGSAFPGVDSGVVTGWAETCSDTASGFEVSMSYLPTADDHVSVYAAPDLDGATYAWAIVPITGASMQVPLLDSPVLDSPDTFGPGTALSWAPVAGAREHTLAIYDDEGVAWRFYGGEGEAAFPDLPEGAPLPALRGAAAWMVYARDYTVADDGTLDTTAPYLLSAATGGAAAW
ncbi:MAG: carboxypeptidase-like regulatory domain-containing protein [Pseudomonadota bacterium]